MLHRSIKRLVRVAYFQCFTDFTFIYAKLVAISSAFGNL